MLAKIVAMAFIIGLPLLWAGGAFMVFGVLCLMGAAWGAATLTFRATETALLSVTDLWSAPAAIGVAVVAAILPLFYFVHQAPPFSLRDVPHGWPTAITTLIGGYISYVAGHRIARTDLPARAYVIAVVIFAVLSLVWSTGVPLGNDDDYDPPTPDERHIGALVNYVRYVLASYAGLTLGFLLRGVKPWKRALIPRDG